MKIICIGRNYTEHIKEFNDQIPKKPLFFLKPETSLLLKNRPFYYPDFSNEIHYETELVLKIFKIGKHIQEKYAHNYYTEIGIGIDFTARDLQNECIKKGLPWEISKGFDFSAPISHFIPVKKFNNMKNINFHIEINDKIVQKGNSKDMIFSFEAIIAYISRFITLKIGDLIFTGTPAGVGPVKIGDHLKVFIEEEKMMDFFIK
ncbi:MAG: fumarylacetoacetate hydrolase family protein [Bacteroidales bacterium]|nr:fumarylacetoacetate hydrolase family protein [Bacteroidales bacterium]